VLKVNRGNLIENPDFLEAIFETRKEMVLQTYRFVQDIWMSLYHPEEAYSAAMTSIHTSLMRPGLAIDLPKPADENLYKRVSPLKLLTEFEKALHDAVSEEPVSWDKEGVASLGSRTRGRNSRFGSMAREVFSHGYISEKKYKSRGGVARRQASSQSIELIETWLEVRMSLEKRINEWKSRNLRSSFEDTKFAELRREHILPSVKDGEGTSK
jgi:hypothetical protein